MEGRPKGAYDPFLAPTMPPIPPVGMPDGLPPINSLMRIPTTSASPVPGYNPHLLAAQQQQQQQVMYQPYSATPSLMASSAALGSGYQSAVPVPAASTGATGTASPLSSIPAASESPQIYDLDKNFHLNAPVPQYPPPVVGGVAGEIPPPGYAGHYPPHHHQRPPPMYGNYHPTSSYNYTEDYYSSAVVPSAYNNYTDYPTSGGYPQAVPGVVEAHGVGVLQPLGQQVTQLQPVLNQQAPTGSLVTTLGALPAATSEGQSAETGKKSGGSSSSGGGSSGSTGGNGEKKAEKKPTQSSMARYVCAHCDGKEFVSLPVISKHIRQHNLVLCNLCVRTFETSDDLKSHECRPKGSNVSYPKCPICLKYLSNSWSLSRHMKTHNREQGGTGSKDMSSSASSDIKSSESEESSNAKLDLEGSAMDCDDLSKDMLRHQGGEMDMEMDGDSMMGDSVNSGGGNLMQDMMLKSPRVVLEKLSFPHFTGHHSNNSGDSIKSETGSEYGGGGGKMSTPTSDDEGLVDEKSRNDVPLEKCIVCGKEFKNRTYLYKHLKSVHTAKILKSVSGDEGCNTTPGSSPPPTMKEFSMDTTGGSPPVKSSVARALASKLTSRMNGKAGDEDPDSNNNGGGGGSDYLVPLTSSNANQININTSGNSITIISNVTYCNTAHEVPITTSTGGPPVTTASEAAVATSAPTGAVGMTTLAGSNGTVTSVGGGGGLPGDTERRLSFEGGEKKVKMEMGVKEEFKMEPPQDGVNLEVTIKQEQQQQQQQQQEIDEDVCGENNKLLEPPPFIIQKVKKDVVVVTGTDSTAIVQPNLIDSDAMLGKAQFDKPRTPGRGDQEELINQSRGDQFVTAPHKQNDDPYAFHVDQAMESHFGGIDAGQRALQPPSQPPHHVQQQQQQQQQPHQQQQLGSVSNHMHHATNYGEQSQQNHLQMQSNQMYGASNMQQQQQPQQISQFMNAPPHAHYQQPYDPLKMYPEQPQMQHHNILPNNGATGMEGSGVVVSSYSQPSTSAVTSYQPLGGDMLAMATHPLQQQLSVSAMEPQQTPSQLQLENNNPSSQHSTTENSSAADGFDGDASTALGDSGEQDASFQSGGDAAGDSEPKTQICDECGKSFAKRSQLTRHKNIHKNIIYICPFCQREPFKARNSLKNHLKTNHKDMKEKWEDPAYISAQVIKEPEKVDEYMRNWNEKTKPGLNSKGGKGEEKNPVDMLESMSSGLQQHMVGVVPPVAEIPVAPTTKGKKKKGGKAKGGAAAAVEPVVDGLDGGELIKGVVPGGYNAPVNGPPGGKVEAVGGAPDYYNGGATSAAPLHHHHQYGATGMVHQPYPNAYQPPYMGMGQTMGGEYGHQIPPGAGLEHHHLLQQPQQQQPPHHHHHQAQSLYQTPGAGGAYQVAGGSQQMMAPGGSIAAAPSPYGQQYPPQPPPSSAHHQHVASSQSAPPSAGQQQQQQQYGGHHGKSSNSVPASPLRSSLQSPMSPPVSPHPQQFYNHQVPGGHHYYGAQPPLNPYRSASGLTSRQSPAAPFSPHGQQPTRTQSTDSASSSGRGGGGGVEGGAGSASSVALVTSQYAPYGHHQQQQQQPQPPQQVQQTQQQYNHQYGPPQGAVQAPVSGIYGAASGGSSAAGSGSSSAPAAPQHPVPPTPPPSASSFSSNASTSSTSSTSSAYGQSATPSGQQHHHLQQQQHHQQSYHTSSYDGQQPPASKRPRYYPPGGGGGPASGPAPPPPHHHHHVPQQQQQQQQQQPPQHQYYAGHHHLPPNGASSGLGGALSHHHHHQQMYNGMQPPPPSAGGGPPGGGPVVPGGANMGAPGYQ